MSETVDPSRSSSSSADPQQLIELIPELGNTILNLYNRSSNFQGETIPQLCYFETVIRISKFMTTLYLASGLNTSSMSHMVLGTGIETSKDKKPRGFPTRGDIATSVMRAYPSAIETLTVLDASRVLGGIASVLGAIKFKRRKAMITQELVRILIPGLIQARVIGAAEAGIHPAAGLQAGAIPAAGAGGALDSMEQEMDIGIIGLLEDMCAAYGILRKSEAAAGGEQRAAEAPTIGESIVAENELRAFGWGSLKVHVLRNCMSLCEALPDFHGLLNFTAQLLRMGGADLSKEEQLKLATSLSRTVGASKKLGLAGIETEYWDAFLVRDVEIVEYGLPDSEFLLGAYV